MTLHLKLYRRAVELARLECRAQSCVDVTAIIGPCDTESKAALALPTDGVSLESLFCAVKNIREAVSRTSSWHSYELKTQAEFLNYVCQSVRIKCPERRNFIVTCSFFEK